MSSPEPNSIGLSSYGIDDAQAAELRTRFSTFAEDWDSPEMNVYDDYDPALMNLKSAEVTFRQGWLESQNGQTRPVSELWDDLA